MSSVQDAFNIVYMRTAQHTAGDIALPAFTRFYHNAVYTFVIAFRERDDLCFMLCADMTLDGTLAEVYRICFEGGDAEQRLRRQMLELHTIWI